MCTHTYTHTHTHTHKQINPFTKTVFSFSGLSLSGPKKEVAHQYGLKKQRFNKDIKPYIIFIELYEYCCPLSGSFGIHNVLLSWLYCQNVYINHVSRNGNVKHDFHVMNQLLSRNFTWNLRCIVLHTLTGFQKRSYSINQEENEILDNLWNDRMILFCSVISVAISIGLIVIFSNSSQHTT
jgi:hypothetical protein